MPFMMEFLQQNFPGTF